MKFLKDAITKYGEVLIIGDLLRLEEDQDGRVSIRATGAGGTGILLDDLTDVTISAPATDHFLRYNGTFWTNTLITAANVGAGTFKAGTFTIPTELIIGTDPGGANLLSVGGGATFTTEVEWWASSTKRWGIGLSGGGGLQLRPTADATNKNVFVLDLANNIKVQMDALTGNTLLKGGLVVGSGSAGMLVDAIRVTPTGRSDAIQLLHFGAGGYGLELTAAGGAIRIDAANGVDLQLVGGTGAGSIEFSTAAVGPVWNITSTGHFVAITDNSYDIGATGATRPRTGYFGTSTIIGTDPGGTRALRVGGGAWFNADLGDGYVRIDGDVGVADKGGILLDNSSTAALQMKMVATFTGAPGTTARYRMGWVNSGDTETFLNAGSVLEVQADNDLLLNQGGTGNIIVATDPGASEKVRIGGTVRIGNAATTVNTSALSIVNTAASAANMQQIAGGRIDNTWYDSASGFNAKRWDISVDGLGGPNTFFFATRTDAGVAATAWLRAIREAEIVTDVVWAVSGSSISYEFEPLAFRPSAGVPALGLSNARWGKLWSTGADFGGNIEIIGLLVGSGTLAVAPDEIRLSPSGRSDGIKLIHVSVGNYELRTHSTGSLHLGTNDTTRWVVGGTTGHLIAQTDNTFDFGATAANRPRTGYFGTSLIVGTDPVGSQILRVGGNAYFSDVDGNEDVLISRPAGFTGGLNFGTAGSNRWGIYVTETAEGGGNTGSNFRLRARDDGGVFLDDPISINRIASGTITTPTNRPVQMGNILVNAGGTAKILLDGTDGTIASAEVGISESGGDFRLSTRGSIAFYIDNDNNQTDRIFQWVINNATELMRLDEAGLLALTGNVNITGIYRINSIARISHNSNYTILHDPTGNNAVWAGDTGDPGNYYDNTSHVFRGRSGAIQEFARLSSTVFRPSTAGAITLGTQALPWGAAHIGSGAQALSLYGGAGADHVYMAWYADKTAQTTRSGYMGFSSPGSDILEINNEQGDLVRCLDDFQILNLGVFDSLDIADDQQILVYHAGGINKWQAESIQFVRGTGDFKATLLGDNTAAAYVLLDPGAGADSPVGAPPNTGIVAVEVGHKAFTLSFPTYSKPADFRYFEWQFCTGTSCSGWTALVNATSRHVVHSRLTAGTIYRYRVRVVDRAGNTSVFQTTGDNTAVAQSDTQAFGGIIAGEISTVDLTALAGDIGILITGQMRGAGNTYGINFGGVGGIPATWTKGINFEETSLMSMSTYINFHDGGIASGTFIRHPRLDMRYDGTVLMYHTLSGQPAFKLTATDFLLQNSAAVPVHGILLSGTRPASWLRYLDLADGVFTVKDNQGSPVLRTNVGKVGAGTADYGLQVFDNAAATIMDFTGSKRILAVPVQPSVDVNDTFSIDLSTGLTQQVRLTSGTSTCTFLNPVNGGRYRVWMQQDTVGSRAFPTIKNAGVGDELVLFTNETPPVLTVAAGQMDLFEFEYRTTPTARFTCMPLQINVTPIAPRVQSRVPQSFGVVSGSHLVVMPTTVNPGDLLMINFVTDINQQFPPNTPSGWTRVAVMSGNANACFITTLAKVADGTEDGTNVNVTTTNNCKAVALIYRIDRWFGTLAGIVASGHASGLSTTPSSTSLSPPWSNDRNLWFSFVGSSSGTATFDAVPTNYTNNTNNQSGGTGCGGGTAERKLYAASEDPSTWTMSASVNWAALTIAVRPPG